MTRGAREASFRSMKTISETLADEIIACGNATANSYAFKKKEETERVAKGNR